MPTVPRTYDPGDMISLNANFKNKLGALADPSSVVVKVRDPEGNQSSFTPVKSAVGVYYYDYVTEIGDPVGHYEYRFEGTGAITSAEEGAFVLRATEFT